MQSKEGKTFLMGALNGNSDIFIALETAKRLDNELKVSGKTKFTMADIRRIQKDIFKGA